MKPVLMRPAIACTLAVNLADLVDQFAAAKLFFGRRHTMHALFGRLGLILVSAATVAGLAPAANANDRSLRATMIPAGACWVPGPPIYRASLFRWEAANGSGLVLCPLLLNNIELGDKGDDNDMSKFRVFYRDSDGAGDNARVTVDFYKAKLTNAGMEETIICSAGTLNSLTSSDTSITIPCQHDIDDDGAFYLFRINLASGGSDYRSDFIGIDFPK